IRLDEAVSEEISWVAIHDAARPCVTSDLIDRVFRTAQRTGAAIPTVPVAATLKRVRRKSALSASETRPDVASDISDVEWIHETISREDLREAQTPQVFERRRLAELYGELDRRFPSGRIPTDDAQIFERSGIPVAMVPGSPLNLKITTRDDLCLAEAILRLR
ncbi:MAG: 2-C-methyl-D-erythritol 4-phosphate cytidylyltransferase, partial [Planctomycetia bacterium]|nr:2-C-methyl-D-erythritol 4-phosphate cytidylyltransferase [Planctomycetia bacterium]